jgi:hypothetical protein
MPIRREPAWSDLPLESILSSFEAGHLIQDISDETGLPVLEVFQREKDLHLIPANEAFAGPTATPA